MKFSERFLLVLCLIAFVWFFALVPGGAETVMITLTLLSMFYFLFGLLFFSDVGLRQLFKGKLKEVTAVMMVIGVLTGIALSIVLIGILFKLLYLPGADEMLKIGIPFAIVMLAVAVIYSRPPRRPLSKTIFSRLIIFLVLGIAVLVISPLTLVKLQYRNHPRYIEAFSNYSQNPRNRELWDKLDLERKRVVLSKEEFEIYERYRAGKK
jgi:hypothetical protein